MSNEKMPIQENQNENAGEKKRGKFNIMNLLRKRGFRYGGFNTALILIVIAVVVLVNVGVTALDTNWDLRWDLTSNKMYKISPQTENILKNLTEPVVLIGLYPEESTNELTQLLNRYRALNPEMVTVRNVDIQRNPTYVNKFRDETETVAANSVIVTDPSETRFRVIQAADMFETEFNYETYESTIRAFIGEQAITNAVVFVTSEKQDRVFFLQGHVEATLSSYNYIVPLLEQRNMEVAEIEGTDLSALRPGDILVIASPQRDLSVDERETLKTYLEDGGNMVFMRNADDAFLENFNSLLSLYGVTARNDLIIDNTLSTSAGPIMIVPEMASSPITDMLRTNNMFTVFPYASSFDMPTVEEYNRTVTSILTSSSNSYGKTDLTSESIEQTEEDLPGPRTLGLTIQKEGSSGQQTKIAAFGNAYFITDQGTASYSGNADLFLNTVQWMAGESTAVSIVGKNLIGNKLAISTATQFYAIAAVVLVVIPIIILAIGLTIYLRRRHL